jgi:uncharacterized protein (TIGR02145 family)
MKNIFLLILLVAATFLVKAQAPNNIPYQAVVRNTDGSPMASSSVTITLSIHNLTATGDVVYQETHSTTTNTQGLVSLSIGSGTPVTGNFAAINWGSGSKFLHVLMNAGSGVVDLGTQQMMSVPYALYAEDVNVRVSATGDTLFIGNNYSIVPGVSAANPVSTSNYGSLLLPGNTTCQNEYISVTGCGGQDSLLYYDRYYSLTEIGGQCWFAENLATDKYSNGDNIPTGLINTQWLSTTAGAYAVYNNDMANDAIYGKLYNWYTTVDTRGVCPTGWHVPSDCEWMFLEGTLGLSTAEQQMFGYRGSVEGGMLKKMSGWSTPNVGASDLFGFGVIGAGVRWDEGGGIYGGVGEQAMFWSTTLFDGNYAWNRQLSNQLSKMYRYHVSYGLRSGFSIRCVKN